MGWDSGTSELGPLNKWNPVFGMFWTNCLVRASSNWSLHTGLIPRAWHIKSIGSWDILSKWSIWLSEDSIRTVRQPRLAPSISSRREAKLHTEKQQSRKIRNINYSHDVCITIQWFFKTSDFKVRTFCEAQIIWKKSSSLFWRLLL